MREDADESSAWGSSGVLTPVARDAPAFSALRPLDEAPTCLRAVRPSACCSLCVQAFEKGLPSEAELSMRALVLALRSVRESLRSSAPWKPQSLKAAGLSLPLGLCCPGAMFREGLRPCLPERPCFREVMRPEDLRRSQYYLRPSRHASTRRRLKKNR